MKVLLITTAEPGERFVDGTAQSRFAQLAMPSVAAATPPEHEIVIKDEKVESLEDLPDADVAGITLHTAVAPHAYRVARRLRERGTYVVLGGPHVSALPHEALKHADAVVVGDAEDTWPKVLEDYQKGRNEGIYASTFPPLDDLGTPRLDLLKQDAYPTLSIAHATRGCPFRCDFCSVPGISGARFRYRPVEKVAAEVAQHKNILTVFWDDNLTADKRYAAELFDAIAPLKKNWISQATILFAHDRELVRKAARAGCVGVFLGIESFSAESLRSVNKGFNKVHDYRAGVKNLKDHGILAGAGIVFGLDHDDASVFERTLDAIDDIRFDCANFNILTPFPGTPTYDRIQTEGRLLSDDWARYQPNKHVVFQPRLMSPSELLAGHKYAVETYFRPWPILKRFIAPKGWRAMAFSWWVNWHYWKVKRIFDWDESIADLDTRRPAEEPRRQAV